jgi:hypothetical protein
MLISEVRSLRDHILPTFFPRRESEIDTFCAGRTNARFLRSRFQRIRAGTPREANVRYRFKSYGRKDLAAASFSGR